MSQLNQYRFRDDIRTMTGDAGGAVSPDAGSGDLKLLGGTNITTTGHPVTNDITVDLDATITLTQVNATTFDTNNLASGVTLSGTTLAADGTNADINITVTPKGTGDLVITTGDVNISSGNLDLPTSTSTVGQLRINSVRYLHNAGDAASVYLGPSAGNFTMAGATDNIGLGSNALQGLTSGDSNIALGTNSGVNITSSGNNVAIGGSALSVGTTPEGNVALGFNSMLGVGAGTSALYCVAAGYESLKSTNGSSYNTALGYRTGDAISTGSYNTALGTACLTELTTGDNNVGIGTITGTTGGGSALTGADHSNICIMNVGVAGDVHTTRIGTQGTGAGQQDKIFVAGAYGTTVTAATTAVATVDASGQVGSTALATNGQVLIGSTGAAPVWATITAGTGISVSVGAGTTTIDSTGGSVTWSREAGAAVAAAVNHGYINAFAGLTTITLPATAVLGSVIEVIGEDNAGWTIVHPVAGHYIQYGNMATTANTGSLSSTNRYDTVKLVCRVADTVWHVVAVTGVLSLA